jgi:hypothetical protein
MTFQLAGIVLSLTTFVTIAAGHVFVRRLYPIFGTRLGIPFMLAGGVIMIFSLLFANTLVSAVLGIVSITTFWDGIEFFRQEKREQKGVV